MILKAVVYRGPTSIKVEDVDYPRPRKDEVLVKFRAGSICGTDLHFYKGEWTDIRVGQIMGHDACGRRIDTDERVAMIPILFCGSCGYCLHGKPHLCEERKTMGFSTDGFFAEYIAIPERNLLPIPDDVSDEEAAILEPVALAIHTFDILQPRLGEWATIIGQGPIGLLMTQVAKLRGCRVIVIDLEDYRLRLSERYGAEVCINAREEDPVERVKKVTERGSDMVVEAAGRKETVEQTPFLVRSAGRVALIGESEGYLKLGQVGEAMFFAGYLTPFDYSLALDLISKRVVDVKSLITHKFRLVDFEKAIQTAADPSKKPIKVVLIQ